MPVLVLCLMVEGWRVGKPAAAMVGIVPPWYWDEVRCMLVLEAPVRLLRARLVATVVEAPPTVPRVPGPTDF